MAMTYEISGVPWLAVRVGQRARALGNAVGAAHRARRTAAAPRAAAGATTPLVESRRSAYAACTTCSNDRAAPFTIAVPDDVLDDLRARLRSTRFARPRVVTDELVAARTDARFPHPTAPGWEAGVDPAYLRSLVEYWADEFDWRAAEAAAQRVPAVPRGRHAFRAHPSRPDPGRRCC